MSVLVIDDDDDMRALVRLVADLEPGVGAVFEASSGEAGVAAWRQSPPDVVVMDHRMPGLSGLEAARTMLDEDPTQPIILFSAYFHDATVTEAARLGVRECVSKDEFRRLTEFIVTHGRA